MRAAGVPLGEYIAHQVKNLCGVLGIDDNGPLETIDMLLGPAYFRPISEPPLWPSDVADDETPVELSFTLDDDAGPRMRILGEPLATNPGPTSNLHAALQLLGALSERYAPSLNRFDTVSDLFLPGEPQGKFSLWISFIFGSDSRDPTLKIYFNPNVRGASEAHRLVAEALERLGFPGAFDCVSEYGLTRGNLDRLPFFSLDLEPGPRARVKVYIMHDDAQALDAQRAAEAVEGIDSEHIRRFCESLAGDVPTFSNRPLTTAYDFVEGDGARPSFHTLHLPIRDYVANDSIARQRLLRLLRDRGEDSTLAARAIEAVSTRPLDAGSGLISYISLRSGPQQSGTTIYLSSEAYSYKPALAEFAR
ncbi:tryptophan dimethylallyltransferase family protein [Saccharopolyspora erythraea]|uniref:tryptophan dimethylallyltransferase family protein n=1 Tax=Saccharopolyspora erythraea TaxID=1836 RepID=UPI00201149F9|nr:tryptophan dimethylallyltransferase family protein [Saccharopolyspora erythraea]